MCVCIDSVKGMWDLQFSTGSKQPSREVVLCKIVHAGLPLLERIEQSRSQIIFFVCNRTHTEATSINDYTTVTRNKDIKINKIKLMMMTNKNY